MAKRKRGRGYARAPSKKITLPPPVGTYDPGLDAQRRQAMRGAQYTTEDLDVAGERASSDFGLQTGEINRQYQENLNDLLQGRQRTEQDYQNNLQTLARNYQQLGNRQTQAGAQAGLEGGFAAQAARKRAANQQIEKAPLDLSLSRFLHDSVTSQRRLGEAKDRAIGQLGIDYSRGNEDRSVTGRRTGTELSNTLADINDAATAQFKQNYPGMALPTRVVRGAVLHGQAAQSAFQQQQAAAAAAAAAGTARARARGRRRKRARV